MRNVTFRSMSVVLLLCLAASTVASSAADTTPAAAPPLKKVSFRYPVVTAGWLPFMIAKDLKLFEKYGLDVDISQVVPDQQLQAVLTHDADIGGMPSEAVVNAVIAKAPVAMIGCTIQELQGIVVGVDGVNKIQDFKGGSAVVAGVGLEMMAFHRLEAAAKMGPNDIGFVIVHDLPSQIAAVKAGQARGYLAIPPFDMIATRSGLHKIIDMSTIKAPYIQAALFTTRDYIEKNPATIKAFMEATTEGLYVMKTEPTVALNIFLKYSKMQDKELAAHTVEWAQGALGPYPTFTTAGVQNVLDLVATVNPAAKDLKPADVADNRIVEALRTSNFDRTFGAAK